MNFMTLTFRLLTLSTLCLIATSASAQMTTKCQGESWEAISEVKYGKTDYGVLLTYLNRKPNTANCPNKKFVRLLGTIKHKVKAGQTIEEIKKHFLRGKGRVKYLRQLNELPGKTQPKTNSILFIPTKITLPNKQLDLVLNLIETDTLLEYNRASKVQALHNTKTIHVPMSPGQILAPVTPVPVAKKSDTSPADPADKQPERKTKIADKETSNRGPKQEEVKQTNQGNIALIPEAKPDIPKVVQARNASAIEANYAEFTHASHIAVLGQEPQCQICHIDSPRPDKPYFEIPEAVCTQYHALAVSDNVDQRMNQLPLIYSHNQHLDPQGAVAKDYTTACALYHRPNENKARTKPTHSTCVKCHNVSENKVTVAENCEACHGPTERFDRDISAKLLLADHLKSAVRGNNLIFAHESHVAGLQEQGLTNNQPCESCHSNVRSSKTLDEIEPQKMSDCLDCHQGLRKVAEDTVNSLDSCQTCHIEQMTSVKPSFSNVVDKPISHTAFFRKNHGKVASEDKKVCQSCHSSLAGGSGENCDRCHSQMRPSDHTPRFKEHPHGRAAIRSPERCASCHQVDRCVDCHSVQPRDHFPKQSFIEGGHGRATRFSTRKCMTCHQVENECSSCHNMQP